MLKDDFFTIREVVDIVDDNVRGEIGNKRDGSADKRRYRVELNASHPIFQAHFAGNSVMPGACIVQMIKELTEDCVCVPLLVRTVRNMKFLKVVNPLENAEIFVQMTHVMQEDECVSVSAVVSDGDSVFSKAMLLLKPQTDPVLTS